MSNISLILAFSAGLLSFLSPCVLPLVPAYITYITGSAIADLNTGRARLYALYKSLGFVLGFSLVFIAMGASITSIGRLFAGNMNTFRKIGGTLIVLFGIHITGLFKIKTLYYEKRLVPFEKLSRNISSVFIGMAFAAGWTPCVGPILASILIYAGSMETVTMGILLLAAYSLGLAVPFILTAYAVGSFSGYFKRISGYLNTISIISGVLLILMGILIFTNKIAALSRYFDFFNL
ncbi:MAG TPA: cytochrome c biogenesis protein CcdA [Bacillota bacterium]|nr:cytochrome c biogenesis protein CcdA [Bacillota bacterium]HNT03920.1 cytochrome c biogenesis protein CcdA [Bacillota bacterium]HPA53916.1 cytochrome c biogenesis protein CcdA [Bacillota bacterium]HPX69887.1 cytochrome c biogenesis protein CcdA [Bacillota bacterium]HQA66317.1 cytochrome c biogenesis protein CcdA [Bacillota bacterium]